MAAFQRTASPQALEELAAGRCGREDRARRRALWVRIPNAVALSRRSSRRRSFYSDARAIRAASLTKPRRRCGHKDRVAEELAAGRFKGAPRESHIIGDPAGLGVRLEEHDAGRKNAKPLRVVSLETPLASAPD
jgi:hypothetical protein